MEDRILRSYLFISWKKTIWCLHNMYVYTNLGSQICPHVSISVQIKASPIAQRDKSMQCKNRYNFNFVPTKSLSQIGRHFFCSNPVCLQLLCGRILKEEITFYLTFYYSTSKYKTNFTSVIAPMWVHIRIWSQPVRVVPVGSGKIVAVPDPPI